MKTPLTKPKVSIVMTFFKRASQFHNTMRSFVEHGYGPEVEVIVVDDGSPTARAESPAFPFNFTLKIIYLDPKKKWYSNPCIPFNIGLRTAKGDIVIIQNAECCHYGNVVQHALANVSETTYLAYACYSLNESKTQHLSASAECLTFLSSINFVKRRPSEDGEDGWYNHSQYNPVAYHFCSAIAKNNLKRIGYFDRRYAKGIAYDDNEILEKIRRFPLAVVIVDEVVVIHQCHNTSKLFKARANALLLRNKALYEQYTKKGGSTFLYFVCLFRLSVERPAKRYFFDPAVRESRRLLAKSLQVLFPWLRSRRKETSTT